MTRSKSESTFSKVGKLASKAKSDEGLQGVDGAMCKQSESHQLQSVDWLKKFQPTKVSDLVVHPKKLEELKSWFQLVCAKFPNRILVLEGPTGKNVLISKFLG